MAPTERNLIQFALNTLAILATDVEWTSDTADDIAEQAIHMKLATTDQASGLFTLATLEF